MVILLKPKEEKFAALNKVAEKPRSTLSRNISLGQYSMSPTVGFISSRIGKEGINGLKIEGLEKTKELLISTGRKLKVSDTIEVFSSEKSGKRGWFIFRRNEDFKWIALTSARSLTLICLIFRREDKNIAEVLAS